MSRRSRQWKHIAHAVKLRDGWRCTECGSSTNLEAHHITPLAEGGDDHPANLTTLCRGCHKGIHSTPGRADWLDLLQEVAP